MPRPRRGVFPHGGGRGGLDFGVAVSGDVPEPWEPPPGAVGWSWRGQRGEEGEVGALPRGWGQLWVPWARHPLCLPHLQHRCWVCSEPSAGVRSSPVFVRVPWVAPFVPKKLHGLTPEERLLARHGAGPPRSTGRAQAEERQVGASHEALHRPVQGDTAGTWPPRGPAPGAQALVTASPGSKPSGEPGQPVLGATWR